MRIVMFAVTPSTRTSPACSIGQVFGNALPPDIASAMSGVTVSLFLALGMVDILAHQCCGAPA